MSLHEIKGCKLHLHQLYNYKLVIEEQKQLSIYSLQFLSLDKIKARHIFLDGNSEKEIIWASTLFVSSLVLFIQEPERYVLL